MAPVSEGELRERRRLDALLLAEIGQRLTDVSLPGVVVRLPSALADRAAAAWDRDDGGGPLGPENAADRLRRDRAATLALIGAAVRDRGRREGDEVVVELGADLITQAVDAADDIPA